MVGKIEDGTETTEETAGNVAEEEAQSGKTGCYDAKTEFDHGPVKEFGNGSCWTQSVELCELDKIVAYHFYQEEGRWLHRWLSGKLSSARLKPLVLYADQCAFKV